MRIINQSISLSILILILMLSSFRLFSQTKDNPSPPPIGGSGITIKCVNGLEVKEFNSKLAWKVIVSGQNNINNENITYRALGIGISTFSWKFGDIINDNNWDIKPANPLSWDLNGTAFIPYDKLPNLNSDFGETHCVAKVESLPNFALSINNPTNKKFRFFIEKMT